MKDCNLSWEIIRDVGILSSCLFLATNKRNSIAALKLRELKMFSRFIIEQGGMNMPVRLD